MSRRWTAWFVCGVSIFAGALASAQESIRVGGSVVDEDGTPLAAAIALRAVPTAYAARQARLLGTVLEPASRTRTGAEGGFRVEAPSPGMWRLEVTAPGRAPAQVELYGLLEDRELLPIELRPRETVRVVVRDAEGRPVSGALASAFPRGRSFPRLAASRTFTRPVRAYALTDASGAAELPVPQHAEVEIRVNAAGFEPAEAERSNGEEQVRLVRSATRTARVVDAAGEPLADALVSVGSPYLPYALSADDGAVVLPVPTEGSHRVLIETAAGGRAEIEVSSGDGVLDLRVPGPVALAGKVIDGATRAGIADSWVWTGGDPGRAVRAGDGGVYELAVAAAEAATDARPTGAVGRVFARATGHFQGQEALEARHIGSSRGPTVVLEAAARIYGVVLDQDGAPVASALVRFRASGRGALRVLGRHRESAGGVRSDREGRFQLSAVPVDTGGRVVARATGFAPARVEVAGLPAGASRQTELRLEAGRRVSGSVVDELDRPVAGAEVTMQLLPEGGGDISDLINRRFGGSEPLRAWTDAEGAFELRDLEHGRYDLRVEAATYAPASVPAVEVPDEGRLVELGTVTLSPGVEVVGRVVDAEGAPIGGAEVALNEREAGVFRFSGFGEESEPDAVTDDDGHFRIGSLAENSRVDLQVKRTGYADGSLQGVRAPTLEPVTLRLQAASMLRGIVVDDRGKGIAHANLRLMRAQGQSSGSIQMVANMMESASADQEGRFEVENLAAGRWDVSASSRGFQPAEKTGIEIMPGVEPEELRIALERGAALEGTVFGGDGKLLPGATVRKVEADQDPFSFRGGIGSVARTDGDGHFHLDGLPPGTVSIRVDHDKHQRLVRDVTVRPGDNAMDFHLSAGWQISGRVVDETGLPVAGANVTAEEPSGGLRISIGRREGAQTAEDGTFTVEGLADGSYFVNATKSGYAGARTEEAVKLEGQSVYGIDLRLERGASITGQIVGLEFDQLSKLQIFALQPGGGPQPAMGQVDYEGSYRIDNLRAGDWMVMASVGDGGRSLRETVTIDPGTVETVLDLEFGGGLSLTGQVLRDEQPAVGINLFVSGKTRGASGQATTDQAGRFVVEGLQPDTYTVVIMILGATTADQREVELTADREIVITLRESAVTGRVLDALDGRPIAGAELAIQPIDEDSQRFSFAFGSAPRSEADGTFRLAGVSPGRYSLQATKEGYAAGTVEVEVADGVDAAVEIRLESSSGLVLYVLAPSGQGVEQATVAVLDAAGKARSIAFLGAGEAGRVELADLPAGKWTLLVSAGGTATREVRVSSPGEPVTVRLPETGALRVRVPELQDSGARAEVKLLDGSGKPYRSLQFRTVQEEWTMLDGIALISGIPSGTWTVQITTADGAESWSTATRVVAGAVLEVSVE